MDTTLDEVTSESLMLVVRTGGPAGVSWPIDENGLVIGRNQDCDIVILDSHVSRRHCRIERRDGQAFMVDLGSRNTTMVNGRPTRSGVLRRGDELGIGHIRLGVVTNPNGTSASNGTMKPVSTRRFIQPGSSIISNCGSVLPHEAAALTIAELANLQALARELWSAQHSADACSRLEAWLIQLFSPSRCWVGLNIGRDDQLEWVTVRGDHGLEAIGQLMGTVSRCMREQEGIVSNAVTDGEHRAAVHTMAVPLVVAGQSIGVFVLAAGAGALFTMDQLRLLMAVANTAAPWFKALGRIEAVGIENERLRLRRVDHDDYIGTSAGMTRVRAALHRAAAADRPVLIRGEAGVGKERTAQVLWQISDVAEGPFVPVRCAATPPELFERELLGYEQGQSPRTNHSRIGLAESANGGMLFLDEPGALTLENQRILLDVLERMHVRRVGGAEDIPVTFRVVSVTRQDLAEAVESGHFLADLYTCLHSTEIVVPPLRKRRADIPALAAHFLEIARNDAKGPVYGITSDALDVLKGLRWPGNVRELRTVIERTANRTPAAAIEPEDLALHGDVDVTSLKTLAEVERLHIQRVLHECGGRISKAARILGVGRTTLYDKLARGDLGQRRDDS